MPKPPLTILESRALSKEKNSEKVLVSYFAWPKKSWYLDIQSRVLSKGKNSDKLLTSNLVWPEEASAHPSNFRVKSQKIPKIFGLIFGMTKKKLVSQSVEHSVKDIFWKIINVKFGWPKKSWWLKNSESRMLGILKIFWPHSLAWPKKSWCLDNPPSNRQSPE